MNNAKKNIIDIINDDIYIGNYPFSWWKEQYGLPLHINYAPIIRRNIQEFKRVFNTYYPNGHIRYAAKVYCHPVVFKIIQEEDIGVDVCSYNETRAALDSGIEPAQLILNGNSKEDFLLQTAINENIIIVVDSIDELHLISHIASQAHKEAQVIIRVSGFAFDDITDDCIFTSGLWTKFGTTVDAVQQLILSLDNYPNVEVCGFHMHIGSQISDKEPYLLTLGKLLELGHLLKESGEQCNIINIGGGFPLSYMEKSEWDYILNRIRDGNIHAEKGNLTRLYVWGNENTGYSGDEGSKLKGEKWIGEKFYTEYPKEKMLEAILQGSVAIKGRMINTVDALKELGEPALIVEPGRSIIGDAGVTLAKVNNVKKIAYDHNLVSLEMGVVNYAGSVVHKLINRWAIINDYNKRDRHPFETFVCGNLCYNGDIIAKYKVSFQRKPKRGDIVLIYDTGGTESHFFASNANSYPRVARILLHDNGTIEVVKRRETYEEVFSL